MIKLKMISIFLCLLIGIELISCGDNAVEKKVFVPLSEITFGQAEKQLFEILSQKQKSVVWPGGSETSGCYTNIDKERFYRSNYQNDLENEMRTNKSFLESILSLKKQDVDSVDNLVSKLQNFRTYITWRELGYISQNGTTEAGSQVQLQISLYFTEVISEFLKLSEEEILQVWERQFSN